MNARPVVVVGAGIGGLACAARLAARGVAVEVLERAATVGGKLREIDVDGAAPMDAGPTVLTMRWVFDELFDACGERLDDRLSLTRASVLARHAWDARGTLDLHADVERSVDAIAAFAGPDEGRRYRAFCERAQGIYRTLEQPFLRSARPNPVSLASRVGLRGIDGLTRISPFATMWSELCRHFDDPRLRQLFGRYATYCGSSPFAAPATLMLVAHVEREGVWLVDGGMHRIAVALRSSIERLGGRVRCDADVTRIAVERGRARAVVLASGERIDAAAVVFNGDAAALADGLVGDDARRAVASTTPGQRSLSAITWHLRARATGVGLLRHNVYFGADSAREFAALFDARTLPDDPTVYVCAQDRGVADEREARALDGAERLMCLVNAPADADRRPLDGDAVARVERRMRDRLASCGLTLADASPPRVTTPTDFARRYPGTGGALYGRATHGWAASFERPSSTCRVRGLFLVGGSVHPGPGLPMAALSGELAARRVLAEPA